MEVGTLFMGVDVVVTVRVVMDVGPLTRGADGVKGEEVATLENYSALRSVVRDYREAGEESQLLVVVVGLVY